MNYEILWVNGGSMGFLLILLQHPQGPGRPRGIFPWPKWQKLVLEPPGVGFAETMEVPMEIKSDRLEERMVASSKKSHIVMQICDNCHGSHQMISDAGLEPELTHATTVWEAFGWRCELVLTFTLVLRLVPLAATVSLQSEELSDYPAETFFLMDVMPTSSSHHSHPIFSRKGVTTHKKRNMEACSNMFSLGTWTSSNYMWTYRTYLPSVNQGVPKFW